MDQIKYYKKGGIYILAETYRVKVDIHPKKTVETRFLKLSPWGQLTIRAGYAWDGPSGPTIATKTFMRGSLVHDALYELMRMERMGQEWREPADRLLVDMCKTDGMCGLRRAWVFQGVHWFAASSASPKNRKVIHTAPDLPKVSG